MADPSHRPGSVLLGNTSQVAVDADGYVVLHDPEYLRLDSTSDDTVLIEQSLTDGLLLEPYDCECCTDVCGWCTDAIGDTVTVDLGVTDFHSRFSSYYGSCNAPCEDFEGEFILTRVSTCQWEYVIDPFCDALGGGDAIVHIITTIQWNNFALAYEWKVTFWV